MKKKKEIKNLALTEEEIATNHIVKSNKTYLIVFGIFFLTIILLLVGSLFRTNITPDYPLVFRDANNKLMVITKSGSGKKDITTITDANIAYANKDIRYLLYSHNNALFLLDTTSGGEGKKLAEDITKYGFSSDDKTVYYITKSNELHIYNRKNNADYLIDNKTTDCLDIVGNYVIYDKNSNLILKNYNIGSTEIISKSYKDIKLSKDEKAMLYSVANEDNTYNYYLYTFADSNNEKVLTNISEMLSYNTNFTKFIYTIKNKDSYNIYNNLTDTLADSDKKFVTHTEEDVKKGTITKEELLKNKEAAALVSERNKMREYAKNYVINGYDLYYQNKETMTLLASGINKVYYDDIDTKKVVYTKNTWDKTLDLSNYSEFEEFKTTLDNNTKNGLYYTEYTNKPSLISENLSNNINVYYGEEDAIYYTENKALYYSKITNKNALKASLIEDNLELDTLFTDYANGLVYLTNATDNNSLKYIYNGKYHIINEQVYTKFIKVSESQEFIYYIKNYKDNMGTLMLYNGIRNSKVADNVSSLMYINDDLIYLTTNYDTKNETCDLYRLNGNKLTLIHENILEWFSPVITKQKENKS